jgi:nitrate reductase gamma subunit
MYEFARGPLVWIAFVGFAAGLVWQLASRLQLARKDKVVYSYLSGRFGLRSLVHWLTPLGSRNMRLHAPFTAVAFGFHLCLLVTPLFAMGHAVLWQTAWGVRWWSLPAGLADAMTLVVIAGGVVFALRRVAMPEVRNVTTWKDYGVVLLVVAPFVTGFVAHHQWLPYRVVLTLHIVTGAAWLLAIPFTRLSHMIWFVATRAYMGSEFGAVRHARDW